MRVINTSSDVRTDGQTGGSNVSGIIYSPDGKTVFVGDKATLNQWDLATAAILRSYEGLTTFTTTFAISPNADLIVAGSEKGELVVWDAKTTLVKQTLILDVGPIWRVVFLPDSQRVLFSTDNGMLALWDVVSNEIVYVLAEKGAPIGGLAISSDGKRVLSGAFDGTMILWDMQLYTPLHTFTAENGGHKGPVMGIAFSPDNQRALSGSYDNSMILWDLATYMPLMNFAEDTPIRNVAFSPDGQFGISGALTNPTVWNLESGAVMWDLVGHAREVFGVAYSPDGRLIATRSLDGTVRLWDTSNGALVRPPTFFAAHGLELERSSDGQYLLVGTGGLDPRRFEAAEVALLDAKTGEILRIFNEATLSPETDVTALAFSPDNTLVAASIIRWQQTEGQVVTLWETATGKILYTLEGQQGQVLSIAFSPDGKTFVTGTQAYPGIKSTLAVWEVATGRLIHLFGESENYGDFSQIIFNSDGQHVLVASSDNTLALFNIYTGEITRRYGADGQGHSSRVTSLAYSPDEQMFISSSEDKTLILWDSLSGEVLRRFTGHAASVMSVVFSPDSQFAFSGSFDFTIIQWDIATGEAVRHYTNPLAAPVSGLTMSTDGRMLYSVSYGGDVEAWRIDTLDELITWVHANRYIPELTCTQRELYQLSPCNVEPS